MAKLIVPPHNQGLEISDAEDLAEIPIIRVVRKMCNFKQITTRCISDMHKIVTGSRMCSIKGDIADDLE